MDERSEAAGAALSGVPQEAVLELLRDGEMDVVGRLIDASNATFVCQIVLGELAGRCVYKPIRGERPLDDFPPRTLANRERAAYLLSEAMGWQIVPPTVLRDGPFGPGMAQLWVEVDEAADVYEMVVAPDDRLRRICVFDVIANNADRKGGHLLPVPGGHVHGVDHGVCFAHDPKLRTVLWGWRGAELSADELGGVERAADGLRSALGEELAGLLSPPEVEATARRAEGLLRSRRFPQPDPTRPSIPWPPF